MVLEIIEHCIHIKRIHNNIVYVGYKTCLTYDLYKIQTFIQKNEIDIKKLGAVSRLPEKSRN